MQVENGHVRAPNVTIHVISMQNPRFSDRSVGDSEQTIGSYRSLHLGSTGTVNGTPVLFSNSRLHETLEGHTSGGSAVVLPGEVKEADFAH